MLAWPVVGCHAGLLEIQGTTIPVLLEQMPNDPAILTLDSLANEAKRLLISKVSAMAGGPVLPEWRRPACALVGHLELSNKKSPIEIRAIEIWTNTQTGIVDGAVIPSKNWYVLGDRSAQGAVQKRLKAIDPNPDQLGSRLEDFLRKLVEHGIAASGDHLSTVKACGGKPDVLRL
jgi:hypothetical protein